MNLERPRHLQGALEWRRPKDQRVVALFDTALVHRTPGNQPGIAAGTATVAGDAVRGVVVKPVRGFLAGPGRGLPESKRMVWWVQAEALLGFLNAYQVTQRTGILESLSVAGAVHARQLCRSPIRRVVQHDRDQWEDYWGKSQGVETALSGRTRLPGSPATARRATLRATASRRPVRRFRRALPRWIPGRPCACLSFLRGAWSARAGCRYGLQKGRAQRHGS